MERATATEILDGDGLPDELVKGAYRDLARIHWWLGDTHFVIRAIREDPMPVRRILDVGCGTAAVMEHVRRKLGVEIDLKPRLPISTAIRMFQADAGIRSLARMWHSPCTWAIISRKATLST